LLIGLDGWKGYFFFVVAFFVYAILFYLYEE